MILGKVGHQTHTQIYFLCLAGLLASWLVLTAWDAILLLTTIYRRALRKQQGAIQFPGFSGLEALAAGRHSVR